MKFISILLLIACYIVALGFATRIVMYAETGNEKYKHDVKCWNFYKGKH